MDSESNAGPRDSLKELTEIRELLAGLLARVDRLLAGEPVTPGESASKGQGKADTVRTKGERSRTQAKPAASGGKRASPFGALSLEEAVVKVLREASKPMSVEAVFRRLQQGKAKLPTGKPKLAVRKILFNKRRFQVERGAYVLKE